MRGVFEKRERRLMAVELSAIAAVIAAIVYFNFGTLSPCGVLRETVRHGDGLVALLPDNVVDLALTGRYGALSPGRCLAILMNDKSTPIVNIPQTSRPLVMQPTTPQAIQPTTPQASPQPDARFYSDGMLTQDPMRGTSDAASHQ